MPVPSLEQVQTPTALPAQADVVVLGGGIVGVATALALAESGVQVVLCEKGVIAGEQSSRNWGWVRQMGRDPAELPLTMESLRIWRGLDAKYGIETGFRETGITYVCRTRREIAEFTAWAEHAKAAQMPSSVLDQAGLSALLPGISGRYTMGLHTASDGRAEPGLAVPAMAKAAQRLGAVLLQNCAVRGVETAAGRVSAVVTERGIINTSSVVVAGGVWSRLFLGNLGVNFPQLKILGTAARITTSAQLPEMPVGGGDFAFRKRLDGGYTVALRNANVAPITPDSFRLLPDFLPTLLSSWHELKLRVGAQFLTELKMPRRWSLDQSTPFEQIRTLDPQPHDPFNQKTLVALTRAFPAFGGAQITHSWGGMIDATPDAVPVIGPVNAIPGLHLASGFSGHGFGVGPGAGQLMADIVQGDTPCVDPAPFRLERFKKTHSKRPGKAA